MHILLLSIALLVGIVWWRKKVEDEEKAMHEQMHKANILSPEEQFRKWSKTVAKDEADLQKWLSSLSDEEAKALSTRVLTFMQSESQTAQDNKTLEEQ